MSKVELDPSVKSFIETNTGIKIDGKPTLEEAKIILEFLHGIAKMLCPDIDNDIDARIDKVEEYAMTRKSIAKGSLLALTKAIRMIAGIPDDDDNTVQK